MVKEHSETGSDVKIPVFAVYACSNIVDDFYSECGGTYILAWTQGDLTDECGYSMLSVKEGELIEKLIFVTFWEPSRSGTPIGKPMKNSLLRRKEYSDRFEEFLRKKGILYSNFYV